MLRGARGASGVFVTVDWLGLRAVTAGAGFAAINPRHMAKMAMRTGALSG